MNRIGTQRGAATLPLLGIAALLVLLAALVADTGSYLSARARASAAADAAALAAAPVTFRSFGARGGPGDEAARFAVANGAVLVSCRCVEDPSWSERRVEVVVEVRVATLLFGSHAVRAIGRAEFRPVATAEPP